MEETDDQSVIGCYVQHYSLVRERQLGQTNEAPMLKALVDAGELPPLSERLPREPLVVEPVDGIGKYGGYLQHARTITHSDWYMSLFVREPLDQLLAGLEPSHSQRGKGF